MIRTRLRLILIAVSTLFLLSGCVTFLEDVTIHEDGSGFLRFAVGVDSQFYLQFLEMIPEGYTLENMLATLILDEEVENVTQDTYESEGQTWQTIQLDFADMAVAFEGARSIGPITLSIIMRDDEFTFEQSLDMAGSNMSIPGVNLLDLSGAGYTVRLTAPQITDTNGLQSAAGVSVWDVSLGEFLQEGEAYYHEADYVLEPFEGRFIPWETFFPYVVIGFLVAGVLSILIVILVNTRKKGDEGDHIKFDI